jgi:GT2 family glycosyltransferase
MIENSSRWPYVSVIVPVYNDPERLDACLRALAEQAYPLDRYEVIVVDNGSDSHLRESALPGHRVRLIIEAEGGSYLARNAGIAVARGEVFAFTDADCLPCENWLFEGVAALLRHPDAGLLAGRVEIFFEDPARPKPVELYEKAIEFRQDLNVEREKYAVTANLFTWRDVVQRVGPFDATLLSGGDTEWGMRVHRAGYELVYSREAAIRHPARSSFRDFARKVARVAYGNVRLHENRSAAQKWRSWMAAFVPPLYRLKLIWDSDELQGPSQKVKASSVAVIAKYLWTWHRLRYTLGLYDKGRKIT